MAEQPRTQKQIAQKYKDNLDYYRHGHFFRRLKLICFLVAVFGSIGLVFGFRFWGNKEYFNTGPLSQNHARFANNCQECHEGVMPDLSRALRLDQAITDLKEVDLTSVDLDKIKALAASAGESAKGFSAAELKLAAQRNFSPERLSALRALVIKKSSLAGMDRACLKCHDSFKLHQPQAEAIKLRAVHPELPLVHADRCSTCHREHIGHGLMKLPDSQTCASCHADLSELKRTRNTIKITGAQPPTKAENRDLGDRFIRFIMPPETNAQPAVIKSYADGHPPFRYEGIAARDPAQIKYNHQRHEQADIPLVEGRKLDCADCHQVARGSDFYQPVKYQANCAKCHSLQLFPSPELRDLTIPHGEAGQVQTFVLSLTYQMASHFMRNQMPTDQIGPRVTAEKQRLEARYQSYEGLTRRVFFGDQTPGEDRLSPNSNTGEPFTACIKCHMVTQPEGVTVPKVAKVNMADRWIHHGPFTHLPHTHMSCDDCHGAAHKSILTTDVLLPPQKLCAECHRPLLKDKVMQVVDGGVAPAPGTPEMAARQRQEGGVKWECQSCHHFHAEPDAIRLLEAKGSRPIITPAK
jgi:hypothetical protein